MSDEEFESADAGSALSYPIQCSALRKNGHVLLKGNPCKIVDMSTSKTGKHGHAKVNLVGIDIFTGKKYEDMSPSTHNMEVPNVSRTEYPCMDITEDGYASLMADNGDVREDLSVTDDDLLKEIKQKLKNDEDFLVVVLKAMGKEKIMSTKTATK